MNTTLRRLNAITAAAIAALTAAAILLPTRPAVAEPVTPTVIQLPRVVVSGRVQRSAPPMGVVAQLPRVVVTGQRIDRPATLRVQAPAEPSALAAAAGKTGV